MLNTLSKLFSRRAQMSHGLQQWQAKEHKIPKGRIAKPAIDVITTLQKDGWQAYLVGGGVRDLLLGKEPKDFDVATDATPEQVRAMFKRARIIGRRFKIVHVRMGRELIEVTTFRDAHDSGKKNSGVASQNQQGMLLRDNVYGDLESDAKRRDFTVNALYYDPTTEVLSDYFDGVKDIQAKVLRMIGDPRSRYKEDPVRMLRAARFEAKLDFTIDQKTEQPISELSNLLAEIPPARLFEETLKLFLSGKGEAALSTLHRYKLLQYLCPSAARALDGENPFDQALLENATQNTDDRIANNKRVTPAFIFAAFLWPALQQEMKALQRDTQGDTPSNRQGNTQEIMQRAMEAALFEQQRRTSIPKRFQSPMREIWSLQVRLQKRYSKRALNLLEHPRFRAAYDFVLLREQAGEDLNGLGQWWTEFQFADSDQQHAMLAKRASKRRRRPRKRRSA